MKSTWKRMAVGALAAAGLAVSGCTEREQSGAERGAEDLGNSVESGARRAGEAIQGGAERTGEALERGAEEGRRGVQEGSGGSGEGVELQHNPEALDDAKAPRDDGRGAIERPERQ
jgi:hypothetical protein